MGMGGGREVTPPQIMGGREPDPIGPEPGMGGCSVLLVQLNGWGGGDPKMQAGGGEWGEEGPEVLG